MSPTLVEQYLDQRQHWSRYEPGWLGTESSSPSFLLTVDDGYRSFLTEVLPRLEQYDAPCLLFVTTGFVADAGLPFELRLASFLANTDHVTQPGGGTQSLRDHPTRKRFYERTRLDWKPAAPRRRDAQLIALLEANGRPEGSRLENRFLTWEEIARVDAHPLVTVGSHSVHHAYLPKLDDASIHAELQASANQLEEVLGRPVDLLAYPYGASSRRVRQIARSLGVTSAFTGEPPWLRRLIRPGRLEIPRLDLRKSIR